MGLSDEQLVELSEALAAQLLYRSRQLATAGEARRSRRLRRLLASGPGPRLVFGLADRVLRPVSPATAALQLRRTVAGPLPGVSRSDALQLHLGALAGLVWPGPVVRAVSARLRYETSSLVLPADDRHLARRLVDLARQGRRPNVNLLGEAVLGRDQASARAGAVAALLRRRDVDCVSVKASALACGLDLLDFEGSVERVVQALVPLYRLAATAHPAKLVNLDMEEYRDLELSVAAFCRALSSPGLEQLVGGIAVQAYLPATHAVLGELLEFATRRRAAGAAPIRIRLVKGANLAMEAATAELAGWPAPCYRDKAETDASYKLLLERLLRAGATGVVQVGAATHNLFDVAFAIVLAGDIGADVDVEMLAGMADPQAAAVAELTGGTLVYTPVVTRANYRDALAYLARRLDENATPDGFLRHSMSLEPGNGAWQDQRDRFARAVRERVAVRTVAYQCQDRSGGGAADRCRAPLPELVNEAPTDLTVPANRAWAATLLDGTGPEGPGPGPDVAPVGASAGQVLVRAAGACRAWEAEAPAVRQKKLQAAALAMSEGRADALRAMVTEAGKTFGEADAEVSEGVDYARWYGGPGSFGSLLAQLDLEVDSEPLGVVVVAPPWNFPYAIPAGGALAALAAGNCVVLKPAPEVPGTARVLFGQLAGAGFPEATLQLAVLADGDEARKLVCDDGVGGVVLTGSYATARNFARWAPNRRLLAETSGKNAIVVAATADVDQAVRDTVVSAFGHAGQKCSAASLVIVEASVHDRTPFLRQLADAVRSLRVGPADDPATQVGPVVGPFTAELERALCSLDAGESWLVRPEHRGTTAGGLPLWSPGVRLGVRPGSWAHMTDWFGPVLGVMRAAGLYEALEWQNAVPFGLTAGICSLDDGEQQHWADRVEAGNVYVNRPTTGAVVGRQPFGGWKCSSYGPTAKAGGPNYLIGLRRWRDPEGAEPTLQQAAGSYRTWWERHFSRRTELAGLRTESNELRYVRYRPGVVVRASGEVPEDQLHRALEISQLTGTPLSVSTASAVRLGTVPVRVESDESFAAGWRAYGARSGARLRLLGTASPEVAAAAAATGTTMLDEPICSCGRVELVRWLREQCVTRSLHRYGNVVYARWGP